MLEDGRPIFMQIAEAIENSILDGSLKEGDRVPSISELTAFYRINPATASKGLNLLVERGIVDKRRGLGMFVKSNAKSLLLREKKSTFARDFLAPLLREARYLGIELPELTEMLHKQDAKPDNLEK